MVRTKSKSTLTAALADALSGQGNERPLYAERIINYGGTTKDTREPYSEVVSTYILRDDNLKKFQDGITPLTNGRARKPYIVAHHRDKEILSSWRLARRQEEHLAHVMYGSGVEYPEIGTIKDFQVPLKDYKGGRTSGSDVEYNPDENVRTGKIDLVSYNRDANKIYLLELKRPDNHETLLRAALEIYTYRNQIAHHHIDPSAVPGNAVPKFQAGFGGRRDTAVVPAVLVAVDSDQYAQFMSRDYAQTRALIQRLGVDVFAYTYDDRGVCQIEKLKIA